MKQNTWRHGLFAGVALTAVTLTMSMPAGVAVATNRAPVGARDRQDGVGEGPLVCTGVQWWIGREALRRHVASLESKLHHRAKELCREGS